MLVEYRFFCSSLLLGRLNVFKCLHIFCCDFWIGIYYQCFLCKVRQKKTVLHTNHQTYLFYTAKH